SRLAMGPEHDQSADLARHGRGARATRHFGSCARPGPRQRRSPLAADVAACRTRARDSRTAPSVSLSDLIFSDSPAVLFGRLIVLCGLIFLAGRAGIDLVRTYAVRCKAGERVLVNPNYVSIAFGPTLLLFITWALKVADLYSFGALLVFLSAIVALAVL